MPSYSLPRCEVVPVPDQGVSFQVDGRERLRWHFTTHYPRPFFYPFLGPSGSSLVRMGHPGAPNHDHHQAIWFAHAKVLGIDFWSNQGPARVRQQDWLAYQDGDAECQMAAQLGWYDGHDPRELLQQQLVAVLRPGDDDEMFLELQSTFHPVAESLELGQTNFGFLAVRMAKSISVHFGGGELTNSHGAKGEPSIFGKSASWVDYSGPVPVAGTQPRQTVINGITFFDHPENPRYPTAWHVREDGWMGASPCLDEGLILKRTQPLVLRYLLHAHGGPVVRDRADAVAARFHASRGYRVEKSAERHRQFEIRQPGG
ncbi:MAG: PmoA family protein [Pirellulaceae bacterium]